MPNIKQKTARAQKPAIAAAPRAATSNGSAAGVINGAAAPLHQSVTEALQHYFAELEDQLPQGLYEMVITEVERPLLAFVMAQVDSNQSRAAAMLGLNRGTLRKKLLQHGLLDN